MVGTPFNLYCIMSLWSAISKFGSAATSLVNPLTAIASPIVSLVEGANNRQAQREANAQNVAENQANRDFNAQQSAIQRQFEAQQAQFANQFSHNEALEAFNRSSKFQKEMWNAENAYNSPDAQIKRLMDAGLNPNLFGGDNTAGGVGSVSSSPASASMPHGVSASAGSSIPMAPISYTNPLLESANVRLANATAEKAEQEAERTKRLLPGELSIQGMTLNLGNADIELKQSQKQELQSKMQVDLATIRQMDEQTSNLEQTRKLMVLDEKQKQIFLKDYEERLTTELLGMKSKLRLDEWNIKHIASQIALNASMINVNNTQASLNVANAVNAHDVHLLNGIELNYKDKMMKLQYDKETHDYNLSVLEGIKETRIKSFRANESTELYRMVNGALDDVEIITRMAGNIFGSMPDYIKMK